MQIFYCWQDTLAYFPGCNLDLRGYCHSNTVNSRNLRPFLYFIENSYGLGKHHHTGYHHYIIRQKTPSHKQHEKELELFNTRNLFHFAVLYSVREKTHKLYTTHQGSIGIVVHEHRHLQRKKKLKKNHKLVKEIEI